MSADASITLVWREGESRFRLGLREIRIIQDKTGYGPLHILRRLRDEEAFIDEWREVIFQGLIGGGMKADAALKVIKRSLDDRDMAEGILLARAIMTAAVVGVQDDPVGKAPGADTAEAPTPTTEAASSSLPSTEPVLQ